MNMFSS